MNDKLTAQELGLYIGQEIILEKSGRIAVLRGVCADCADLKVHDGEELRYYLYFPFKLLLRPLSDITEGEAIECGLYNVKTRWYQLYFSEWIMELKNQMSYREIDFTPKQFSYLLSKGFDLFNWIEQGKAIDKTKLNS